MHQRKPGGARLRTRRMVNVGIQWNPWLVAYTKGSNAISSPGRPASDIDIERTVFQITSMGSERTQYPRDLWELRRIAVQHHWLLHHPAPLW